MSLITKSLITKSLITKTLISPLIGIDDSVPSAPRFIAGWTGEQGCGVVTLDGIPITHNNQQVTYNG